MQSKANCWEFTQCGREPGGPHTHDLGVCVAATTTSMDGYNNGQHGGRVCWCVAGTLCGGKVSGTFAEKQKMCFSCDFFQLVRREEGKQFRLMPTNDEGARFLPAEKTTASPPCSMRRRTRLTSD